MSYVYYFVNAKKEVVYVGRTNDVELRMKQHFGAYGHLKEDEYNDVSLVYFARVNSENESRIYETYYISKHKPKYNTTLSTGGDVTIELPELSFEWYDFGKSLAEYEQDVNTEAREMFRLLKEKQQGEAREIISNVEAYLGSLSFFAMDEENMIKGYRLKKTDADRLHVEQERLNFVRSRIVAGMGKLKDLIYN